MFADLNTPVLVKPVARKLAQQFQSIDGLMAQSEEDLTC